MSSLELSSPIAQLPMARGRVLDGCMRLKIKTIRQLFFHFPSRYEDRREQTFVERAALGVPALFLGTLRDIHTENGFRRARGKARRFPITKTRLVDETGDIHVTWFHQRFFEKTYPEGTTVFLYGTPTLGDHGVELIAPDIERVLPGKTPVHMNRLVAVYPETAGVSSRLLRFWVARTSHLLPLLTEYLPETVRVREDLLPLIDAIAKLHQPESFEDITEARKRLSFDELFLLQLASLVRRRMRGEEHALPLSLEEHAFEALRKTFPFPLTPSQDAASMAIRHDLSKPVPMNRLLAGDVGSGKTVVAGIAAWIVATQGVQTAFAAPTEILAEQHARNLSELFGDALRVRLYTASRSSTEKETVRVEARRGTVDCVVGTHALFHESLLFRRLGLVVVDEQHRFGVEQRGELTSRGPEETTPHFLSLSATPIPRTLQLTAYGDVDVSMLDPRPSQKPIYTKVVMPHERQSMEQELSTRMKKHEQVFVICPRVEDEEAEQLSDVRSVKKEYERLRTHVFPDMRIGMLYGSLPPNEKERILSQFREGELDLLVASSVVEVGVDIPGATALLVEGANRFGLAQLHQFRGRVGRRGQDAVCFLTSDTEDAAVLDRLHVLESSHQGLDIAEEDLKRRGAGDIYGIQQSGGVRLKMASLSDIPFLQQVRAASEQFLVEDPDMKTASLLKKRIAQLNTVTHFE